MGKIPTLEEVLARFKKPTFQPIAMRCNQEQFDAVKGKLEDSNLEFNTVFVELDAEYPYLTNFYGNKLNGLGWRKQFTTTKEEIHETWNEKVFLEACGIVVEAKE